MKKKSSSKSKIKTDRKNEREVNETYSLDSQLGSIGLEPPKIYNRNNNQKEITDNTVKNNNANKTKKQVAKKYQQSKPLTPQQKRELQNQKRKKNKLKRKIIFYFILTISIAAVIIVLSLTVLFKIDTVKISGNNKYSQKEIAAVLPIQKEQNLFLADTSSAAKKLEENLPYIYSVEIKRKLPSTIQVNVTEVKTVYSIKNQDKSYTILDDNLKVLEAKAQKKAKGAIEIKKAALKTAKEGYEAEFTDKNLKKNLLVLLDAIKRLKLEKTSAVYSNDINNNFIVYDKRITFKLGSLDDIDNKIYSALTATEKLDESNPNVEGTLTVTDGKQVYFTEE